MRRRGGAGEREEPGPVPGGACACTTMRSAWAGGQGPCRKGRTLPHAATVSHIILTGCASPGVSWLAGAADAAEPRCDP
ncbi:hypothetical protein KPATCC21470_8657 [Kitasatospora purpeofusca]